jgi:hypothetical protein
LSYSIDVMRYDHPLHRDEIEDLIRRIQQIRGDPVQPAAKTADQTKIV